jgi:hypothetical protein
MPTQKNSTKKARNRSERVPQAIEPKSLTKPLDIPESYERSAVMFAEILANPKTSPEFRQAFYTVYDLMLRDVQFSHPSMIRATYAQIRVHLDNNAPATADALHEAMLLLHERMNSEEVDHAARTASGFLDERGV